MDLNETQEYLRRSAAANRELDTWAKVSIGMFVGAVAMAIVLGEWSTTDAFGEEIPKIGGRLATPLALVLFGGYHWRRRIVEKKS